MFEDIYNGKRVLVTGHTGFKGSWLVLWLNKLGATVQGYSINIPTSPSLFSHVESKLGCETFTADDVCDVNRLDQVIKNFKPDIIFHLAAESIVKNCLNDPLKAFNVNSIGTANVFEIARRNQVKCALFITSDKCYENVEWEYGYRENDRLGGKDPYSASKAAAEIAFSALSRSFTSSQGTMLSATARAGNVIGGGDWATGRIVPDAMRAFSSNEILSIRSPNSTRPWQHVLEPLSGYLLLGAELLKGNEKIRNHSFNVGPSSEVVFSVKELLQEVQKYWNGHFSIEKTELASKEAGLLKINCDKIMHYFKWKAVLNFKETVEFTTKWYKKYYENNDLAYDLCMEQISQYEVLAIEKELVWTK